MTPNTQLEARIQGIAGQRPLRTTIEYNTTTGSWLVDLKVLNPECPSQTIYSAYATANTLEVTIALAAQALAEKEKQYDSTQQHLSRPVHLPSGYTWAYQLVVKPIHP